MSTSELIKAIKQLIKDYEIANKCIVREVDYTTRNVHVSGEFRYSTGELTIKIGE